MNTCLMKILKKVRDSIVDLVDSLIGLLIHLMHGIADSIWIGCIKERKSTFGCCVGLNDMDVPAAFSTIEADL